MHRSGGGNMQYQSAASVLAIVDNRNFQVKYSAEHK